MIKPRLPGFALHIFALSGIVLAQPVYSWISAQPEFLVAHGVSGSGVLWVVLVLSVFLPLLLVMLVLPARLFGQRVFFAIQALTVGLLVGLFGGHAVPLSGHWVLLVLAVFFLAGGFLYWRLELFRQILAYAAILAVLMPVWFTLSEPVRTQVFSAEKGVYDLAAIESRPGDDGQSTPLMLVLLDELSVLTLLDSQGRIDRESFPNFARLADNSTWYPLAFTPYSGTSVAVSSLVTGEIPDDDRFRKANWQHHPDNLFTWAGIVYHENVVASEVITQFCPQSICQSESPMRRARLVSDLFVLAAHGAVPGHWAENTLPALDEQWHGFSRGTAIARAMDIFFVAAHNLTQGDGSRDADFARVHMWHDFVADIPDNANGFSYFHSWLPHVPYEYLPDGNRYPDILRQHGYPATGDERVHHVLELQRHLAQVRHKDRLLGQLLDALHEQGLWDELMLVVTSDHGRSFRRDTHWRAKQEENIGALVNIPLFIKYPGQRVGQMDEYPAALYDIFPTMTNVTGYPSGRPLDGVVLHADDRPVRDAIVLSCLGRFRCQSDMRNRTDADDLVAYPLDSYVQARRDALSWLHQKLRYSRSLGMHVPAVPESRLLGLQVAAFDVSESAGQVLLFDAGAIETATSVDGHVPALLGGYVEDVALRDDEFLLVALNGKLVALGVVGKRRGRLVMGALLPAHSFDEGENALAVFRIRQSSDQPVVLEELPISG